MMIPDGVRGEGVCEDWPVRASVLADYRRVVREYLNRDVFGGVKWEADMSERNWATWTTTAPSASDEMYSIEISGSASVPAQLKPQRNSLGFWVAYSAIWLSVSGIIVALLASGHSAGWLLLLIIPFVQTTKEAT